MAPDKVWTTQGAVWAGLVIAMNAVSRIHRDVAAPVAVHDLEPAVEGSKAGRQLRAFRFHERIHAMRHHVARILRGWADLQQQTAARRMSAIVPTLEDDLVA